MSTKLVNFTQILFMKINENPMILYIFKMIKNIHGLIASTYT